MTDNLLDATTEFMRLGGQLDAPPEFGIDADEDHRKLRRLLLDEEYQEYILGEDQSNLVETVDGLLDVIVIAWGTLLAYVGEEKAKAAAEEVFRSNLSKVDGSLGPIVRREDGKLMKPEGWTAPDIICCRPTHLRATLHKQNCENKTALSTRTDSGYRGVRRRKNRWVAYFGHNGKTIYAGSFMTAEEAAEGLRLKRIELHTHNDEDRLENVQ